jgi:hypothetical protein
MAKPGVVLFKAGNGLDWVGKAFTGSNDTKDLAAHFTPRIEVARETILGNVAFLMVLRCPILRGSTGLVTYAL